ncbi:MAG: hypothetical protein ACKVJG_04290 [Candidatus Latescibacterota bacterium]
MRSTSLLFAESYREKTRSEAISQHFERYARSIAPDDYSQLIETSSCDDLVEDWPDEMACEKLVGLGMRQIPLRAIGDLLASIRRELARLEDADTRL